MKKLALLTVLLACFISLKAQEETKESKSLSVEFLNKSGSIYKKDFIPLGLVANGIVGSASLEVLNITNLNNENKSSCLRITTAQSTISYVGIIDFDELDACINFMKYLKDSVLNTIPENYMEYTYLSKDHCEIGAFKYGKKWNISLQPKSYNSNSMVSISSNNIDLFIEKLEKAKEISLLFLAE